jgi:hypothetical protein
MEDQSRYETICESEISFKWLKFEFSWQKIIIKHILEKGEVRLGYSWFSFPSTDSCSFSWKIKLIFSPTLKCH